MNGKDPEISVVIVTIGRESIHRTLASVFMQEVDTDFEVLLILQGDLPENRPEGKGAPCAMRVLKYPTGLGLATYRNEGLNKARGEIVVFIDDDAWAGDQTWLRRLTAPIREKRYAVTTSGLRVSLAGNYLTDCISLLGHPGGAALGFERMWLVDRKGETGHVCTANCALKRSAVQLFDERLRSGAEDTEFSRSLRDRNVAIRFVERASVFHEPRIGLIDFTRWQLRRGVSLFEYATSSGVDRRDIWERKRSILNILKASWGSRYAPGVAGLLIWEHLVLLCGYLQARTRGRRSSCGRLGRKTLRGKM